MTRRNQRPTRRPTKPEREHRRLTATAYHEAGHAVIGWHLDLGVRRVTIVRNDAQGSLGHALFGRFRKNFRPDVELTPATKEHLDRNVLCSLAGPLAEKKHTGRHNSAGARQDYEDALNSAEFLTGSVDGRLERAYLQWARLRVEQLLGGVWWEEIEAVAQRLLRDRTITRKQLEEAVRSVVHKLDPNVLAAMSASARDAESVSPEEWRRRVREADGR